MKKLAIVILIVFGSAILAAGGLWIDTKWNAWSVQVEITDLQARVAELEKRSYFDLTVRGQPRPATEEIKDDTPLSEMAARFIADHYCQCTHDRAIASTLLYPGPNRDICTSCGKEIDPSICYLCSE